MTTRSTPWPAGTPCWVDMSVADLKGARRFYGDVLGWSFVDTGERMGNYTLCTLGDHNVAAMLRPIPGNDPLPWTVYLAVDDAVEALALVEAHGGRTVSEAMSIPNVGVMALAVDPCDAVFGVWQSTGMVGFDVVDRPGAVTWTEAALSDPGAGAAFYAAVFGFAVHDVPGAEDHRTLHLDAADGPVAGLRGVPDDGGSRWRTSFAVADLDDAARRVTAAGGREVTPVRDAAHGRHGEYADPEGVRFVLQERPAE